MYAGIGPDFRVIVRNARKAAQKYYLTYREIQPVSQVVKESALLMQEYTQSGGVRPFGVSCLVAGYDDQGPQLFQVDSSGSLFSILFLIIFVYDNKSQRQKNFFLKTLPAILHLIQELNQSRFILI